MSSTGDEVERAMAESPFGNDISEVDPLAIGGLVWLRASYQHQDGRSAGSSPLRMPNFSDVYLDARPNDRLRAYLRGRLRFDPTLKMTTAAEAADVPGLAGPANAVDVALDQFWLKFDLERLLFLTIGKERVKWGAGRFWTPTDFLNQERLDPLAGTALFDERLGVALLKLHLPLESLGWNLYGVGLFEGADAPENVGGALRAEMLFGETEVAVTVAGRKANGTRYGASVSSGLGPVDVHGELGLTRGTPTTFLRGTCAPNALIDRIDRGDFTLSELEDPTTLPEIAESYSRRTETIPQALFGIEVPIGWGDDDSLYVGVEYFFNDLGYAGSDLYPCLLARGAFTPFSLGRHYVGAYVVLPKPGRWDDTTFLLSSIANLSDRSNVSRFDARVRVMTNLDLNAFVNFHFGSPGSEFRFAMKISPLDRSQLSGLLVDALDAAIEVDPRVKLLTSGVEVFAPNVELGVGASLVF